VCGRFVLATPPAALAEHFGVDEVRAAPSGPDYNITPRREVVVVAESGDLRVLDVLRWGLVPPWAKDVTIGDRMINARSETVATSNAYRRAFARRRCIVAADGFYEWKRIGGPPSRPRKQPWYFRRRDGAPLAFAGLWESWRDPSAAEDAPRLRTCTVITTAADAIVAPVHERMPALLAAPVWDAWLDPTNDDPEAVRALLASGRDDALEAWPVSRRVNTPASNDAALIEPVPEETAEEL